MVDDTYTLYRGGVRGAVTERSVPRRRPTRSSATQRTARARGRPARRGRPETRETRRPPYAPTRTTGSPRGPAVPAVSCASQQSSRSAAGTGPRAGFGSNRHIIIKPRRTSRANNTAPCQHFTSTNSHTRVFCLLTRKPHQSKKTSMKNRSRTRHVMVQTSIDWGHLRHMRQSEHPRMSSPLPQPRSHRRRLTSRRPCWLLSESLRPLAFRSPHMTDARGPHGDEIDSSSRLISTHAHDRNALDMSMAPDRPS